MVVFNDRPTLEKDVYIYDENVNLITRHRSILSSESGYGGGGFITGDSSTALTNGNYVVVPSFSGTASPNNDVPGFIGIEIYDSATGELLNAESNSRSIFNTETQRIPENKIIEGIATVPEIQELEYPKVAALSNGGFVVSYAADRRNVNTGGFEEVILAQVFDSEGNKVGNNITLFRDLTPLSFYGSIAKGDYSLTGLENGGFVVAYNNYSQSYRLEASRSRTGNDFEADVIPDGEGLVAQRYDNSGNIVGDLISVKTGESGIEAPIVPSVIGLDDGNFLVTNSSGLRQDNNLFRGQLFDANGNSIGDEFVIEEYPGFTTTVTDINSRELNYTRQLSLSQLENGNLLITGKENDGDSEPNDYGDDYVYTQRLRLNIGEGTDGTEVSVEPVGQVSTLAQYAGEDPPFETQPDPNPNPNPDPDPDPNPDPTIDSLDTDINRFQNDAIPGTYLYAGEAESQTIRNDFPNFIEEGLAFKVATEPGDELIPLYRFRSLGTPGTYLYAAEQERQSINRDFADSFLEEGLAFYVYEVGTGIGTEFIRFQNSSRPGTYLYAAGDELTNVRDNFPNFVEEGAAFEVRT